MFKSSTFAIWIFLLFSVALSQLSLPSPTFKNYYLSISDPASYFDIGSYQLFLTTSGYTITSDSTSVLNAFTNPTCVGTNNSQIFCIDESDDQELNQLNITTGQEYNFFNFSTDIVELGVSFDSILVGLNNLNSQILVIQPPSTNLICNMSLSGTKAYGSATYANGIIFLTSSSRCTTGTCSFLTYYCNNQSNSSISLSYNKTLINNFTVQTMIFTSGAQSVIIGFPVGLNGTENMGAGYFLFENGSYIQNSGIGTYFQVVQINQTNILVLSFSLQLIQYAFNFNANTFSQVGASLSVPYVVRILLSPPNSQAQTALCISGVQGVSNFYVDVSTMSVSAWDSLATAQSLTFSNGSSFSFFLNGYMIGNGNSYYANFMPFNGNSYYLRYSTPYGYPNIAYAIFTNISGSYLFGMDLGASGALYQSIGASISGQSKFIAIATVNNNQIIATYANSNISFYSLGNGLINTTAAPVYNQSIEYTLAFISNQSNYALIYTNNYVLNISLSPWQILSNLTFPIQFEVFAKMTESLFLGWYLDQNNGYLNISVINAFNQSIVQNFIVPSSSDLDSSFSQVYFTINSTGALGSIFVSTFLEDGSSVGYVLYPNMTNYTIYGIDLALPGPGNNLLFCNQQLARTMVNCSLYDLISQNGGSAGDDISIISIIIIGFVVAVVLVGGFLVRRNIILKRNASKGETTNPDNSSSVLTVKMIEGQTL